MLGKIRNSLRRTHDDSRRRSEDAEPRPASLYTNSDLNDSNASIPSIGSIKQARNVFRRSKMPLDLFMSGRTTPSLDAQDSSSVTSTPIGPSRVELAQKQFETPTSTQHMRSPSVGSVRSILRDRTTPGTGRSVRWNGTNSTRVISPNVSSSTIGSGEMDSVETVQRSLLARIEAAGDDSEEFQQAPILDASESAPILAPETAPLPPSAHNTPFPDLLDADPFANATPPPSHRRTESTSSVASVVQSTMELEEPPSGTTNLLDMSDDAPSIALSDSLDQATEILAQFPPVDSTLNGPSFDKKLRPTSADFNTPTPRASMYPIDAASSPSAPYTVFPPNFDSSFARKLMQHARMPSEASTVHPTESGRQSPLKVTEDLPLEQSREQSPLASTPDHSIYQTPRGDLTTRSTSVSPAQFFSFSQMLQAASPASDRGVTVSGDDEYMTPFLVPGREQDNSFSREMSPGKEVLNSAYNVPNNSLFDANESHVASLYEASLAQEALIAQLQSKLELHESLQARYESDLSMQESINSELATQLSKANDETTAWRGEAERTSRRFEKMRGKLGVLAVQCEQLTTQRQQNELFDRASSMALRELQMRVGSLEGAKNALEEQLHAAQDKYDQEIARADQADRECEEALRKLDAAEEDAKVWQQRAHEYERSGEELIGQLNSLQKAGGVSFSSGLTRPASVHIMSIDEVIQSAKALTEGRFLPTPPPTEDANPNIPLENETVYVLKSEILAQEAELSALRAKVTMLEVSPRKSTPSPTPSERGVIEQLRAQLMEVQHKLGETSSELGNQYEHVDRLNEEITCLEEEKTALQRKVRAAEDEREILAKELENAENERNEAVANLEGGSGELEAANEELKSAHDQLGELNAHLDDQRERLEAAQRQIVDLESQLSTLKDLAHGEEDLKDQVKWLQHNSDVLEGKLENAMNERDQLAKDLVQERSNMDELALAQASLKREHAEASQHLQVALSSESELSSRVERLEKLLTQASEAVTERERQCQVLEKLNDATQGSLDSLTARQASIQQELDDARADRDAAQIAAKQANSHNEAVCGELEKAAERLAESKRQNADLEMKNLQLTKKENKLEDDLEGMKMALQGKQQELELVKRKFGVRGTAGATSLQTSSAKAPSTVGAFKVPTQARRSSVTSVADSDDGAVRATTVPSRALKPRVSIATPTPAGPLPRHPSLTQRARIASSSTLGSIASKDAGPPPSRPLGLRRPESMSDAESVSSVNTAPPKRPVSMISPSSLKRASLSPPTLRPSSLPRRAPSQNLKPTLEEVDKENSSPRSTTAEDVATPKASAVERRRSMLAA